MVDMFKSGVLAWSSDCMQSFSGE